MSKAKRSTAAQQLKNLKGSYDAEIAALATHRLTARTSGKARPVKFAGNGTLYQIRPEVTPGEISEQIDTRLDHVRGILVAIHGGGIEQFNACAEEVQDQILSGLFNMVSEVRELFTIYGDMLAGK